MVKLKQILSVKTIDGSLKYQYPVQLALKCHFLCYYKLYVPKQLFLDASNREIIKSRGNAHHQNCFSNNGITPKLPRPSFKSYLTLSSLFLEVEISMANFLSFSPALLSNYRTICSTLTRKQCVSLHCYSNSSGQGQLSWSGQSGYSLTTF